MMRYTNGKPPRCAATQQGAGSQQKPTNGIIPLDKSFLSPALRFLPLDGRSPAVNGAQWNTPERAQELDAKVRNGWQGNIGVYLGAVGGNLVDVDFDLAKSYPIREYIPRLTALALRTFPQTGMAWGRDAQTLGHLVYCDPSLPEGLRNEALSLPNGKPLVELRVNGQSLYWGVHPDTGQLLHHFAQGAPTEMDYPALRQRVGWFGVVALLCLVWEQGNRHDSNLPLCGYLLRRGVSDEELADLLQAVCEVTGDRETRSRLADIQTTARRLMQDLPTTGLPTLLKELPASRLHALGCSAEAWGEAFQKAVAWWQGSASVGGSDEEAEESPVEDEAEASPSGDAAAEAKKPSASAPRRLFGKAKWRVREAFLDSAEGVYLTVDMGDHWETFRVGKWACRRWLTRLCAEIKIRPSETTLKEAESLLMTLPYETRNESREVFIRVGGDSGAPAVEDADDLTGSRSVLPARTGKLYLDLGRSDWQVVEVTPDGWRVIPYKDCPVRFVRPRYAQPLPLPERVDPSEIHRLRRYLRTTEESYPLLLMWLLGAFHPDAPYPILSLRGAQGSGKSTVTRLLRNLIDPSAFDHSRQPRNSDDLFVYALNAHLVAFDNLSRLPQDVSDDLCRLATGGALIKRELYSDAELTALRARRPVILNAIAEIVNASDLADRTIDVELTPIRPEERCSENDLRNRFEREHPRILGALLEGLVYAVRDWVHLKLPALPRMADFALWACAGMQAYGYKPEQSLRLLFGNKTQLDAGLVERDPLAQAIVELMRDKEEWVGTATELLIALRYATRDASYHALPKSSTALGMQLPRVKAPLEAVGIYVEQERGERRLKRIVKRSLPTASSRLEKTEEQGVKGVKGVGVNSEKASEGVGKVSEGVSKVSEGVGKVSEQSEFKSDGYDTLDTFDTFFSDSTHTESPTDAPLDEAERLRQVIRDWMTTHEPFPITINGRRIAKSLWGYAVKHATLAQLQEWVAQLPA